MNLTTLQSLSSIGLWVGFVLAIVSALIGTAGNWASQKAGDVLQKKNETLQHQADERIATLNIVALQARRDIELSRQKTAEANRAAAIARAEAADSKQKAAEILAELEHARGVIASRVLSTTQRRIFIRELRGTHLNIGICYQQDDIESGTFAMQVLKALTEAGQTVRLLGDACGDRVTLSAGATSIAMTGRIIDMNHPDEDPLYRALVRARIWGGWWQFPAAMPEDITHLLTIPARSPPSIEALRHPTPLPQPELTNRR